jgi:hypothetical protein
MKFTRTILSKIDNELEGLSYDANDRNNLSSALFDIAIDHSKSIIILLENGIYSSAYSLVRPMFESFVRAAWVQHCATDEQIKKVITKDKFPLSLGEMLDAVEKDRDWSRTLSKIKESAITNMHSYTHGGMQLIARRFTGSELVHIPDPEEVNELLKFLAIMSFLSFNEMVLISKSTEKDGFAKEIYKEISIKLFPIKRKYN